MKVYFYTLSETIELKSTFCFGQYSLIEGKTPLYGKNVLNCIHCFAYIEKII